MDSLILILAVSSICLALVVMELLIKAFVVGTIAVRNLIVTFMRRRGSRRYNIISIKRLVRG